MKPKPMKVKPMPLVPELRAAMEAAARYEAEIDDEMRRLLTPKARKRIKAAEREFARAMVIGKAKAR